RRNDPVKVSFFGLSLRRVRNPEMTDDNVIRVASVLDIAACKMAVLPQRAEAKDYMDVAELLKNGLSIADALGAAQAVYGDRFNPMITLKALTYFADGDLASLPDSVKRSLRAAAVIKEITQMEPFPGGLIPPA